MELSKCWTWAFSDNTWPLSKRGFDRVLVRLHQLTGNWLRHMHTPIALSPSHLSSVSKWACMQVCFSLHIHTDRQNNQYHMQVYACLHVCVCYVKNDFRLSRTSCCIVGQEFQNFFFSCFSFSFFLNASDICSDFLKDLTVVEILGNSQEIQNDERLIGSQETQQLSREERLPPP